METLLEHAGGEEALRRFTDIFYRHVLADSLLRPLFGQGKPEHVDRLTEFTVESFGGPDRFTRELGFEHLIAVHRGLKISEEQRKRFVDLYLASADEAGLPDDVPFREALRSHIVFGSEVAKQNSNAQTDAELHPLREVPKWNWTGPDVVEDFPPSPEPFPGHDAGAWKPVPCKIAASWPVGSFAENLAVNNDGLVFVSLHSHKRIERYDPASERVDTFATFPVSVTGLAFAADGILWATGGNVFRPPGFIWRVSPDGSVDEWTQIPEAVFLNGCAVHPDGKTLLVCESILGRILGVDMNTREWRVWFDDARLRPVNERMPGANGIKVHDGYVFVSVTDLNNLFRIHIDEAGGAGAIELVASNLRADDFAFGTSGALYLATHPANTVLRLARDGTRLTIAGPEEGAVGSTSCAFGKLEDGVAVLYVTTNGGLWAPYRGEVQTAKLLRLEIGEGAPSRLGSG